ncbi:MAG: hypothetical protein Q9M28_06580 [Mariprofundaceae bacterium]|nr:hypothetical protein [Mariprofundaceae bacterium]
MKKVLKTRNLVVLLVTFLISGCGGAHWDAKTQDKSYKDLYSSIQENQRQACLRQKGLPRDCSNRDRISYEDYKEERESK